ncbi:MAG: Uma2 family endonuclease [Epsilonproteobacteria bacterium]|nr:MAG: Uma2 family endonuclease [Campylobacterota bacterium]
MGVLKLEDLNYTYDDYKLWEGNWELIEGVPFAMSPAPLLKHQSLEFSVAKLLDEQLDDCPMCEILSEVDYKVNENTTLRPDVVFTCNEQNEAYLTKAPEIIVEIISKSTAKRDEVYKFDIYEKEKVKYYIIVYPDDLKAKVYKLDGKKYDKQGDFTIESYTFEETTCKVSLDFEKVFRKYKK